jgi:hypothetical protein
VTSHLSSYWFESRPAEFEVLFTVARLARRIDGFVAHKRNAAFRDGDVAASTAHSAVLALQFVV